MITIGQHLILAERAARERAKAAYDLKRRREYPWHAWCSNGDGRMKLPFTGSAYCPALCGACWTRLHTTTLPKSEP